MLAGRRPTAVDYIPLGAVLSVTSIVGIVAFFMRPSILEPHAADDGAIQIIGLVFISAASLLAFGRAGLGRWHKRDFLMLAYILAVYAMREADLHKALSEHGTATNIDFYSDGDVPIGNRILAGAALIAFGVVAISFALRHALGYLRALIGRESWAAYLVVWFVLLVVSQLLDKSDFNNRVHGKAAEELLEAAAQVVAFAALIMFMLRDAAPETAEEPVEEEAAPVEKQSGGSGKEVVEEADEAEGEGMDDTQEVVYEEPGGDSDEDVVEEPESDTDEEVAGEAEPDSDQEIDEDAVDEVEEEQADIGEDTADVDEETDGAAESNIETEDDAQSDVDDTKPPSAD